MDKLTALMVLVIAVLSFGLGAGLQAKAHAQEGKSYAGVIPFNTSSGRIGFFDQNTGKVYVYDTNITQCLFVGQMKGLGQTIQPLSSAANTPSQ